MFGKKPGEHSNLPSVLGQTTRQLEDVSELNYLPAQHVDRAGQTGKSGTKGELLHFVDPKIETKDYRAAHAELLEKLITLIDFQSLSAFSTEMQHRRVREAADKLMGEIAIPLNGPQKSHLKNQVIDDIFGFGLLEPLLRDTDIADIMINGANQVYVEKQGRIFLTDLKFLSETQLLSLIQRIVSRVGRRVDEASPMVDARMPDGSRFNAIIPPLALDGCLVSIRKFKKNKMPLSQYVEIGSMSEAMARFLSICGEIRLNMMVSGGTGSGKTTLLNALSGNIGIGERVITIEDAAELQMHQPHVLRLETRPASSEGRGEVNQRQLAKNALRMRPDRIILGEIRGDEIIDLLTAMNTGHDGSMATIHANNPRDCLSRIENLVGMSSVKMDSTSLRRQITSALQLIVQIERMRDGKRRITRIEEIIGIEGDNIQTQTLFSYQFNSMGEDGVLVGEFKSHGVPPHMLDRAAYYGRDREVLECLGLS